MSFLSGLRNAFSSTATPTEPQPLSTDPLSMPASVLPTESIYLARQPIFDRSSDVFGYELLYRDADVDKARVACDDEATRKTLTNALVEIGLADLVGNRQAFINLGPEFVFGGFPFDEYKDRLVLEILESMPVDIHLIRAVKKLKEKGYQIALDDVSVRPEIELLFPMADIIKLDLTLIDPDDLPRFIGKIQENKHLKILAEKVEELGMYRRCLDLGCDYFQGYFFARPTLVRGSKIQEGKLTVLRLLAELQNPNVSVAEIERLIKQDVSLSYKLLKYINSAITGVASKISSVRQAITLLGINRVRVLITLLGLAQHSSKPAELIVTALVRARTCEVVGQRTRMPDSSAMFVVGLFSLLDAMLDQPLDVLIKHLPLAEPIRAAILHKDGPMGGILNQVCQFERGDFSFEGPESAKQSDLRAAYMEAIRWTSELQPDLFFQK